MPESRSKVLILGGSGFLSGTLARRALAAGHRVTVVTRGRRELPPGVGAIVADRTAEGEFAAAIAAAGTTWDLVVDCIGYQPAAARQDLEVFRQRAGWLVFISTDFVFDPARRVFPQPEEAEHYLADGYGGLKRACEVELQLGDRGALHWTVLRPNHIYGPGSQLGCLPAHARDPELIARLRRGEILRLVGGGHFLQQPILARDLADLALSCLGCHPAAERIFQAAGPEIVESRTYYQLIAEQLGVGLALEEVPVSVWAAEHPEHASFLCHRVYDLSRLRAAGLAVPATPLAVGLAEHVAALA
ncbi:MAG: NAD-dependent epimerase/dehydratase family protein [Fimbriimonadaceae bacterium]|nr:NAD-dependent epimerase/dehydratase family protein [Fimbriimonadaceae bacterium]